ncbi:hypothetical protein QJQ45_013224 [Haematococcus lacustris]|nr:hypothetical protein QJQ45_013224 [Haematococcus lacustris]
MATTCVRPSDPFGEHVSVMKALYQEYHKRDDFDSIAAVDSVLADVRELILQREASVKDIVKDLSQQVRDLDASSRYPHSEGSHERRVAALKADINVETQRQELIERASQIAQKSKSIAESAATEEPILRHQLSLFAHISKISWRLDQEERIQGTVSDTAKGDIWPVDINPSSCTPFEAVNKLWALI